MSSRGLQLGIMEKRKGLGTLVLNGEVGARFLSSTVSFSFTSQGTEEASQDESMFGRGSKEVVNCHVVSRWH